MFSQLKRLVGDSFLYTFMSVGTKVINFFLVLAFTHILGQREVGAIGVIDSWVAILSYLVIFGTDSALAYYYFEEKDPKKKLAYVQNVMGFRVLVSVVFALITLIGADQLSALLFKGSEVYATAIQVSMWTLLFETIGTLVITVYRFDFKTIRVVVLTLSKLILIVLLSYIFLTYVEENIDSVMYARLISIVAVLLVSGRQIFSFLKVQFDKVIWKEVLAYSAPLVPASLAFWIIGSSNRMFIVNMLVDGQAKAGVFDVAVRFASMITLLTYGIQMAWRPYSMQLKDKENSKELFAKVYVGIFVLGMFGILLITFIMPWVFQVTGEAFHEAYQYVGFLSLGSFLNFYYLIVSAGLFFTKQTKPISRAFGISAVLNLILNAILIYYFQLWGCVVANVITYLLALIMIFYKSQKAYYIPVSITKLGFIFIQTVIAMGSIVFFQVYEWPAYYLIFPWIYFILSLLICRVDKDLRFNSL